MFDEHFEKLISFLRSLSMADSIFICMYLFIKRFKGNTSKFIRLNQI